ncbi:MAG TPA: hypothetical protein DEB24_06555 [Coriobacteriia bacterium]|nr:hypothetical protein [Coriobacteriia bacterium]
MGFPIGVCWIVGRGLQINDIVDVMILHAGLLILGSVCLTLIVGFIPTEMAARKDLVEGIP